MFISHIDVNERDIWGRVYVILVKSCQTKFKRILARLDFMIITTSLQTIQRKHQQIVFLLKF